MTTSNRPDLVESQGVDAGPAVDTPAERRTDPARSASNTDLDELAHQEVDGTTGGGSELTGAGSDHDGPGQELSAGEG